MASRIKQGDRVRVRGDISRRGTVRRMKVNATVAYVKWDFGRPRKTEEAVKDLENIGGKKRGNVSPR